MPVTCQAALAGTGAALLVAAAAFLSAALYIPAKAALAQVLLERAFARGVATGTPQRPWPWADMTPEARLEVRRLGIDAIVLLGASGQAMAFGPGRMLATAPFGAPGTSVVAAHRDTSFRFLRRLVLGDAIEVQTARGPVLEYRVSAIRIVRADASGLDPADPGPTGTRLALVTCYPFDGIRHGPWRYVVLAERTPTGGDEPSQAGRG